MSVSSVSRKSGLPFDPMGLIQRNLPQIMPVVISITAFLLVWQVICASPVSPIPAPLRIVSDSQLLITRPFFVKSDGVKAAFAQAGKSEIYDQMPNQGLGWQVLTSLRRVLTGYSFSAIAGVGIGLLMGSSLVVYRGLDPIIQVMRTVPPLAWLPIALAGLKQAEPSTIFLIFITAIWPILINTAVGVQQVPQDYRNVARVLRLNRFEYFWTILLPSAAPYIFTGLRIAVGLSWLAIVAAEMIQGGVGIGSFIWDTYNSARETGISDIIVALVYVGIVGLVLDKLVYLIGHFAVQSDK
ncbi:MAG: nitrate ABC transporter permease [Oscillatoriales cyanobacterium SM2_2_1]|nr:nitrate ABC transporter permease [Oscillatoriales cyanobacterium SM2_2_1]